MMDLEATEVAALRSETVDGEHDVPAFVRQTLALIAYMKERRQRAVARRLRSEQSLDHLQLACSRMSEELTRLHPRAELLERVCAQVVEIGSLPTGDFIAQPIDHPAVTVTYRMRLARDKALAESKGKPQ